MKTLRATAPSALSLALAALLSACPGNDDPVCGDGRCDTGENATDCPADCGCDNGVVNTGEGCDGDDLDGATCESEGLGAGTLASAYGDLHFSYGTASGDYGMGFDPVGNALWTYQDNTEELIRVQ